MRHHGEECLCFKVKFHGPASFPRLGFDCLSLASVTAAPYHHHHHPTCSPQRKPCVPGHLEVKEMALVPDKPLLDGSPVLAPIPSWPPWDLQELPCPRKGDQPQQAPEK